jgi:hypothetical protein
MSDSCPERFWVEIPSELFKITRCERNRASLFNDATKIVFLLAIALAILKCRRWHLVLLIGLVIVMFVYYNGEVHLELFSGGPPVHKEPFVSMNRARRASARKARGVMRVPPRPVREEKGTNEQEAIPLSEPEVTWVTWEEPEEIELPPESEGVTEEKKELSIPELGYMQQLMDLFEDDPIARQAVAEAEMDG